MDTIFTVTGISEDWPKSGCRCFGWRKTLEDAKIDVVKDKGAMDEAGYFAFIVIEEFSENVWTHSLSETWYEWEDSGDSDPSGFGYGEYVQITKPDQFKRLTNWAMG